jgi:hypothetical protein
MDQQIIPMLAYEGGVAAMQWLCDAFGFTEVTRWLNDDGRLSHGEIAMGDHIIMLAEPTPDYQSPKYHRNECQAAANGPKCRILSMAFWFMWMMWSNTLKMQKPKEPPSCRK